MKILKLYIKELKENYNWMLFSLLAVIVFDIFLLVRIPSMQKGSATALSLLTFVVFLVLMFVKGYRIIKREWDWNTKEFLLTLPLNGFEIALAMTLELITEAMLYTSVATGLFLLILSRDLSGIKHNFALPLFLIIFSYFVFTGVYAIFIETFSLTLRKWRKTIGFIVFVILTYGLAKLTNLLKPLMEKLPSFKVTIDYMGQITSQHINTGSFILPLIYTVLLYICLSLLIDKKMEV